MRGMTKLKKKLISTLSVSTAVRRDDSLLEMGKNLQMEQLLFQQKAE